MLNTTTEASSWLWRWRWSDADCVAVISWQARTKFSITRSNRKPKDTIISETGKFDVREFPIASMASGRRCSRQVARNIPLAKDWRPLSREAVLPPLRVPLVAARRISRNGPTPHTSVTTKRTQPETTLLYNSSIGAAVCLCCRLWRWCFCSCFCCCCCHC